MELTVCIDDHCHGVPANITSDSSFDSQVAWIGRFVFRSDRVDVGCIDNRRDVDARFSESCDQLVVEGDKVIVAVLERGFDYELDVLKPPRFAFVIGRGLPPFFGSVVLNARQAGPTLIPSAKTDGTKYSGC